MKITMPSAPVNHSDGRKSCTAVLPGVFSDILLRDPAADQTRRAGYDRKAAKAAEDAGDHRDDRKRSIFTACSGRWRLKWRIRADRLVLPGRVGCWWWRPLLYGHRDRLRRQVDLRLGWRNELGLDQRLGLAFGRRFGLQKSRRCGDRRVLRSARLAERRGRRRDRTEISRRCRSGAEASASASSDRISSAGCLLRRSQCRGPLSSRRPRHTLS